VKEKNDMMVLENKILNEIFWPRRVKVTGEWRRLHNEEIYNLNSSPTVIPVNKLRNMGWAMHVAHMGQNRGA
jgi:hypothetical protein